MSSTFLARSAGLSWASPLAANFATYISANCLRVKAQPCRPEPKPTVPSTGSIWGGTAKLGQGSSPQLTPSQKHSSTEWSFEILKWCCLLVEDRHYFSSAPQDWVGFPALPGVCAQIHRQDEEGTDTSSLSSGAVPHGPAPFPGSQQQQSSWEGTSKTAPCHGRDTFHNPRVLKVLSSLALATQIGHPQLLWATIPAFIHSGLGQEIRERSQQECQASLGVQAPSGSPLLHLGSGMIPPKGAQSKPRASP